ncbi:MAG: chemotaxis protein CheW [Cyanobacteria bacterium P01_D01_bin.115]
MELDTLSADSLAQENQYILAQVGSRQVAFPTDMVTGIVLSERSQVLALPFYQDTILGIVHYQGQFVTLVMFQQLLEGQPGPLREVFNAIQLSERTGVPGVGLVIDRLLGNCTETDVSTNDAIERFQPQMLNSKLWQPQRWVAATI